MTVTISPTAVVSPSAKLGVDVTIGHATLIGDDVEIGDGSVVGPFCVIGEGETANASVRLGAGSNIRSHSVIYRGCDLGPQTETGHHVTVRNGARTGTNFRLGSYSSLEGAVTVGDWVRVHGYSQIGHGSELGDFAYIFSEVTLTNDPLPPSHSFRPVTVGAGAVVCVNATLLPGAHVGVGAFIGAGAMVSDIVPDALVIDESAQPAGPVTMLWDLDTGRRHPWMNHFADAYPEEAQERIADLRERVRAAARNVPRRR